MFGNLGFTELMVILVIVLVLFGAKRVPEIGASIGKGIKEFKKATKEVTDEINNPAATETATTVTPAQKLPPANTTAQSQPPETKVI